MTEVGEKLNNETSDEVLLKVDSLVTSFMMSVARSARSITSASK